MTARAGCARAAPRCGSSSCTHTAAARWLHTPDVCILGDEHERMQAEQRLGALGSIAAADAKAAAEVTAAANTRAAADLTLKATAESETKLRIELRANAAAAAKSAANKFQTPKPRLSGRPSAEQTSNLRLGQSGARRQGCCKREGCSHLEVATVKSNQSCC